MRKYGKTYVLIAPRGNKVLCGKGFETISRLKVADSVEFSPDIEIINDLIFATRSQTSVVFGVRLKILF